MEQGKLYKIQKSSERENQPTTIIFSPGTVSAIFYGKKGGVAPSSISEMVDIAGETINKSSLTFAGLPDYIAVIGTAPDFEFIDGYKVVEDLGTIS